MPPEGMRQIREDMPKRILFICSANRSRSAVAEYLLRQMLQERDEKLAQEIEVSSAGLVTKETAEASKRKWGFIEKPFFGAPSDKGVIIAMSRRGIDTSAHRSRGLNRRVAEKSNLILTMEERQREVILSRYPETEGMVFTLREFVGSDGPPDIEDVVLSPASGHLLPVYLPAEHFEACISEIEECLAEGVERILHYLQKGPTSGEQLCQGLRGLSILEVWSSAAPVWCRR